MLRCLTLLWSAWEVGKTEFIETNSPTSVKIRYCCCWWEGSDAVTWPRQASSKIISNQNLSPSLLWLACCPALHCRACSHCGVVLVFFFSTFSIIKDLAHQLSPEGRTLMIFYLSLIFLVILTTHLPFQTVLLLIQLVKQPARTGVFSLWQSSSAKSSV